MPQIPSDVIRRFTQEGDVVVEPFMGSGTTLFECERLKRRYVGYDINESIVDYVKSKMGRASRDFKIHLTDAGSEQAANELMGDLGKFGREAADLLILHPPYFDIIKFTEQKCDLSNAPSLEDFLLFFVNVIGRMYPHIRKNGHIVLVAGDLYRNSEVVPLGFRLMDSVLSNFKCKLKGIVIKDMVGNRAKIGLNALWRKRALRSDYYLFKHEYVFVFRKIK